jgi:acetoin:2,6-dichlorophenolindophenol oxidoreductase subunit alpha
MQPDLWLLYEQMLKSRLFEQAIARLWQDGFISGEMHLGTGEEAIISGVVSHLIDGDAMALDHRGTSAMLIRGVDPVLILRELLGYQDGLCAGVGGHMHLYSREHLAASSGIVGASAPAAAGFGIAAKYSNPGAVSVAFFGEGAMNQGMLLESLNLASVWNLPVVFVCKDDRWSITTQTNQQIGGELKARASGLGLPIEEVDGGDVVEVWKASYQAIQRARSGGGATFIHAYCVHLEGHFLGFQLLRIVRDPFKEMSGMAPSLIRSILNPRGSGLIARVGGLKKVLREVLAVRRDPSREGKNDPLIRTRAMLHSDPERLENLEGQVIKEIRDVVAAALEEPVP